MAENPNEASTSALVGSGGGTGDFVVCKVGDNEIITTLAGCKGLNGTVVARGGSSQLSVSTRVTCRVNNVDFVTDAAGCSAVGGTVQPTDP